MGQQVFVECQGCGSVLQVIVPASHTQGNGEVLVRCGKCNRLLRVQLPQEMLAHGADPDLAFQLAPPSAAAHAASSKCMTPGQQQQATSAPAPPYPVVKRRKRTSPYHEFIRDEMKRLRAADPTLDQQGAFVTAASSWVVSGAKAAAEQAQQQQQQLSQANQAQNRQMVQLNFRPATEPFGLPHVGQQQALSPPTPAQGHLPSNAAGVQPMLLAMLPAAAAAAGSRPPAEATGFGFDQAGATAIELDYALPAAAEGAALGTKGLGGLLPLLLSPVMQNTATPAAAGMGLPAARTTSCCSDAAGVDQQATTAGPTAAGTAAAMPAAGTDNPQAPHTINPTLMPSAREAAAAAPSGATSAAAESAAAVSTEAMRSMSSTTCQQEQSAGGPLTLQQTWEALWGRHSTAAAAAAAAPGANNAEVCAPAQQGLVPSAALAPDAPHCVMPLQHVPQAAASMQATAESDSIAAAGQQGAGPHHQQQLQQPHRHAPLSPLQPAAAAAGKQPGGTGADGVKQAAACDKAGHAAILSEGSSLASWSSGQSPNQAANNHPDAALASPGSLSGAGGSSTPGILRHSSAPITTAMPGPSPSTAAAGHRYASVTTAGPAKQA